MTIERTQGANASRFDIVRGEVVPLMPTGGPHGKVEGNVYRVLSVWEDEGAGVALVGEVGVTIEQEPLTVRGADAVFLLSEQLPCRTTKEGYLLTPPALVVEVVSPNDRVTEIQAKSLEYFSAGVELLWVIDPATRTVNVHRRDGTARLLKADDTLWAPGVVENLDVPVHTLFRGLDKLHPLPHSQPYVNE